MASFVSAPDGTGRRFSGTGVGSGRVPTRSTACAPLQSRNGLAVPQAVPHSALALAAVHWSVLTILSLSQCVCSLYLTDTDRTEEKRPEAANRQL
jgi:hypothetical protein